MKKIRGVKRFDYGEMGKATVTPQGFLKIPGFATRAGVFPYVMPDGKVRKELRHPDDVFDPNSLVTLKYAPVTLDHPPVMVSPENVAQYSKGHTTERVEVNRELVDVDLIVEHKDAIEAVEGGIRELSSGYTCDIADEIGTYNGIKYDCRQVNIRYNHLAMVKSGRAGPEVRMRLDSKDAVMRNDDVEPISAAVNSGTESSVADSDDTQGKTVVILGREVSLPHDVADAVQDMMDRYDEMRSQIFDMEEQMKKSQQRADVDINQQGVSPQVDVEQGGPDGRSASGKVAPSSKSDEEMSAEEKAKKDAEEKASKEGKADYQGANPAAGGGSSEAPIDLLKKDFDALKGKFDEEMAKKDAMANKSMGGGEAAPKMDSKDFEKRLQERRKLERSAEKVVPVEVANKFDSMKDDEIRAAVIKHIHPRADLDGKSTDYLQSRFDSICESHEDTASLEDRRVAGRKMLGIAGDRMDASGDSVDPRKARQTMIHGSQELWKQPLSGNKK